MSLTQDLGAFVARVGAEGTTDEARKVARTGFIDCIATMIAGSREPVTTTLLSALAPLPPGKVQLWFGSTRTSASEAALINGVAAHALDYDDVALRGHPSAVLVPAIISAGQELGSTAKQMLDACVAGSASNSRWLARWLLPSSDCPSSMTISCEMNRFSACSSVCM